jgi:mannose-6-phosphate isomerase-like protein (cupin superfamily)
MKKRACLVIRKLSHTPTLYKLRSFGFQKLWLLLLIFVMACTSKDDGATQPAEANTTPANITIHAESSYEGLFHESFQLTAVVTNSDGEVLDGQTISWTSSHPEIATINNEGLLRIISDGQILITARIGTLEGIKTISITRTTRNLIAFTVDDLSNQLADLGETSLVFLDEYRMTGTFVELTQGASTEEISINRDVIYYFFKGSAVMNIEGEEVTVAEESSILVTADSKRSITSVSADAQIIMTKINTGLSLIQGFYAMHTRAQMEGPRNPNQNVWNPFLSEESVIFGLYMLPQVAGGDSRLEHNFDELNIVTRGFSRFLTDEGEVQLEPGSIVYVREDNGHAFKNLSSDTDVLILWNTQG